MPLMDQAKINQAKIDQDKAQAVLQSLLARVTAAQKEYFGGCAHSADKLPADLDALLAKYSMGDPMDNAMLAALAGCIDAEPTVVSSEDDFVETAHGFHFHHGDVVTDGHFRYENDIVVTGDIIVGGEMSGPGQFVEASIGGNLRAESVWSYGPFGVAGDVTLSEIGLIGGGAAFVTLGTLKAKAMIEDMLIAGQVLAHATEIEHFFDGERDEDELIAKMQALVTAEVNQHEDIDDDPILRDYYDVITELLGKGKQVWR